MAGQCLRSLMSGWVTQMYIGPGYNFTFIGFEWLNVLHGKGMYYYFTSMAVLALLVSLGLFYRFSILLLSILWTAIYLSCKTHYNNHYYLMVLLCWLMAVMPANKRFSLDAKINPPIITTQFYQWQLWIFIFQVACVYFFAAIAKMNTDWLHAIPLKTWLQIKAGRPYIGYFLRNPAMPWLIAYGGLLFDLLVVPGLLYHKTRKWFFFLSLAFHLFNGVVFKIGSFPFMAISLWVFFFPAAMFSRFLGNEKQGGYISNFSLSKRKWTSFAIAGYVALQLFLPLRHLLIPGPVGWTEEGHRMSWQMMLRSKRGTAYFELKDKETCSKWIVQPDSFVNAESLREVAVLPDVTWQAAQLLKHLNELQHKNVAVYAHCNVSLNYRAYETLIDTTVDLASINWNYFGHNNWIMHYKE